MDWLIEINAYHWIALGLLLLAAEALGAAGFLIGAAAAALTVGLTTLIVPVIGVPLQLSLFGLLALIATILYLKVFRAEQGNAADGLNQRAEGLVGHAFDLHEALPSGESRVQIGDTFWRVESPATLAAGTRVRVVAAHAMSLTLAAE